MKWCDTIKPDPGFKGDPAVFKPLGAIIYFEDYIVGVDRAGRPAKVRDQDNPPTMPNEATLLVYEPATTNYFLLQTNEGGYLRATGFKGEDAKPIEGIEKGQSVLVIFDSGGVLTPQLAASLRRRARGGTGTAAEAPGWAHETVSRLKGRREQKVPGPPGAGSGETGDTSTKAGTGEPEGGGGPPPDSGTVTNPPAQLPLKGTPTYALRTDSAGQPELVATLDQAHTVVKLHEGEKDDVLDKRIDKAIADLQASRDPDNSLRVVNGAKQTGFQPPPKGSADTLVDPAKAAEQAKSTATAATPGQRTLGEKGAFGANTPPYPAKITMEGKEQKAAVTTLGATNSFAMALDYAAMSFGTADEVFNRMQEINFYWELLDVSHLKPEEREAAKTDPTVGRSKDNAVGPGSGEARNIGRTVDDIVEDEQADIEMMDKEDWPWEARASYLTVIGVSNTVRLIGSLISSFVSLITKPLNERSIGFDKDGEYLLRCVATPIVPDSARADPEHHVLRASSVKAMPIKVMNVNARATEALGEEDRQLARLEAKVKAAKTDDERKEAEAKLEAFKRTAKEGGLAHYQSAADGVRQALQTALGLKTHLDKKEPEDTWGLPELYLQIALLTSQEDVDARIKTLQQQLVAVAGKGADASGKEGEHEEWIHSQAATLKGGNYRPRVVLASEENGQVTPVEQCMLGQLGESTDARPQWRFVDMTSPGSRDHYDGSSSQAGVAGHQEAIRNAFRNFAENNGYGRGTIAIRLPADFIRAFPGISIDERMRSAPGTKGRVLERLSDLAKAAEVAGLVVTGGTAAAVIGAVGGVAGAIVSIDSLVRRSRTGHAWEVGTIFDVLGVVGGVAAVGGLGTAAGRARIEELEAAGKPRPSWISKLEASEKALHIHGTINNAAQIIIIPYSLVKELDEISASGGEQGERDSRRALALLRAIKSGVVTVVQASGHGSGEDEESATTTDDDLPPGFRRDEADSQADGQGGSLPPVKPVEGSTSGTSGEPGAGKGTSTGGVSGGESSAKAPTEAELIAKAREAALVRARQSRDATAQADQTTQPTTATQEGGTGSPGEKGGPGETGTGKPASQTPPGARIETPGESERIDALSSVVEKMGPKPDAQEVRPDATTRSAAADPDAVEALKQSSDFGAIRRSIESMTSLNAAQRNALRARLQEARVAVTNEQIHDVLGQLQERFPELTFTVQDLGTVGFGSDRDVTIRATPKDPAAFAKMSDAEQTATTRQAIQASAEIVPELYKALEAAGFPADRALDTNFYTELHESMVQPASKAEATQIAADQQVVSLSEILINAGPEAFQDYVNRQEAAIGNDESTPKAVAEALRQRLDAEVSEAESNVTRLMGAGPGAGHEPGAREAALQTARQRLVAALKTEPPPTARELRQMMADIKLLEPDAYGTRAAVEDVVLGGQAMKAATLEQVRAEHYRTQKEIVEHKGQPGPTRYNPDTGAMEEVPAEAELARRRAAAHAHVGSRRPGDENASAYEVNVGHLQVMEAVLGHLMGHQPGAGEANASDASTSAKNLGRIVSEAGDLHLKISEPGFRHLPDIVAAKNATDPARAAHDALKRWMAEPSVEAWARSHSMPAGTPDELLGTFLAWSRDQAVQLATQARTRTETAAHHEDAPLGTGSGGVPSGGLPTPDTGTGADVTAPPTSGGGSPSKHTETRDEPGGTKSGDAEPESETEPHEPGEKGNTWPSGPGSPEAASQQEAEASAEITRLRARLYQWRRIRGNDPVTARLISDRLAELRELAAANRRGEAIEGRLAGIREALPLERRLLRPIDADTVNALAMRLRRQRDRSHNPEVKAALNDLIRQAQSLAARMRANRRLDGREKYNSIARAGARAGREDYEVFVDLTDPVVRA